MENKYIIYIGLLKSDMKNKINKDFALKLISKEFFKIGVIGFNCENLKGFWKGQKEDCLKISFINNFKINSRNIFKTLDKLKILLEQESILIERQKEVIYSFI